MLRKQAPLATVSVPLFSWEICSMQVNKEVLLQLEALEDRWVPAHITWTGSTLLIYNTVAYGPSVPSITLSSTGNKVTVTAGSTMTFNNVGAIDVFGGNNNATYDASGLKNYTGSLTINTGNGADAVLLGGTGNTGNTTLTAGNGADTVTLAAGYTDAGTFQFTGGNGNNSFVTNGVTIGGDLDISRANVNLGADTIGGSVNVTDSQFNFNTNVTVGAATIGKNLNVTVGNLTDNVTLNGTTVNGNAGITEGGGNDNFTTAGTVSLGSLNFNAGSGNDTMTVSGGTSVLGNAVFTLGDGNDQFTSNASVGNGISGDLRLTFGGGSDTVNVGGSVSGNAFFQLGDGSADNTTLTGTVGGTVNYRSGNGNDSFSLLPTTPTTYNVDVLFGNFGGTFTINSNVTVSGLVNNTGSGGDVFNEAPGAMTQSPWSFR